MSSFLITTSETLFRTLDAFETGVITGNGSLSVDNTVAIVVQGRAYVANAGMIQGSTGIRIAADVSESTVINTGLIVGTDYAIEQLTATSAEAYLDIVNAGTIASAGINGFGIRTQGSLFLNNSGSILTSGQDAIRATGDFCLLNIANSGTISAGASTAIRGGQNADTLVSSGTIIGDITMNGGNDNISLKGGVFTGVAYGGAGDDTYTIMTRVAQIVEQFNEGIDTVVTDLDWTLDENFEQLVLSGNGREGIGNELNNAIQGNAVANRLFGEAGNDGLTGVGGADRLFGGEGNDELSGQMGYDRLAGDAGNDVLFGGELADTLEGGSGMDSLYGDTGADRLTGGTGADRFVFTVPSDSTAAAFDTITDFARGSDKILLTPMDARSGVSGDQNFTFIGTAAFTAAGQARIVDLGANVRVELNVGGVAVAEVVFLVNGVGTLTAGDFLL